MRIDDRFDDLVASLGGFYRTWYVFVGLELGLLQKLREAGAGGLTPAELARRTMTEARFVSDWAWGADAHDLVVIEDGRITIPEDTALVLLDADRSEYLGGQFLHAAIGSLDYAQLPEVFRTGIPVASRPDRYRLAIERLTQQDVAVFFQEVLATLPELVVDLRPGARILDVHCGGGRWLVAMARRFPGSTLVGVEFEPDSVARARASVTAAVLADRITIQHGAVDAIGHEGEFTLAYFQYALHQLPDPTGALRSAWAAVAEGGWLVALDWYMPSDPDELRTRHGELIAGVQLDELLQGTRLVSRTEALGWFEAAGIPTPELIDLPSGATVIVARP
ncbi:MAG TPA: class I SAM-dependent methyltransferase [Candidatus Limnocylindrales bacterium]|nr:class I SAM-dependent methyltransferase [Candidatus Limnocylindrales bacterium]